MSRQSKIKRNEPCPCLSGEKFKNCCSGKIDWETIKQQNSDYRPYLSVRGRNLLFANRIAEALQLDEHIKPSLKDYKAAFTADAVRQIHEALLELWPPEINIKQALKHMPPDVSGLYIGDYSAEYVTRAIIRHSIYANRILLIDPFIYPTSVRDEYNPIINPAQYRAQTLRNVNLWSALLPWIDSGLVMLIRPPSDFDPRLNWDLMKAQEKKFEESAELKEATKESVDELSTRHKRGMHQQLLLGAPDSYLERKFEELHLGANGLTIDEFMKSIHKEREEDPNFLEPLGPKSEAQVVTISSGASYASASMTAGITGSYLFTDIYAKWREIELDRESHSAENKVWAPFAKALQDAPFKYLNNLRLEHALRLRKEGRLESLREFLRKVWKSASSDDQYDSSNAIILAEELSEQVRNAEMEWKEIDRDLLKIVGPAAVGGLLAAGPQIAAGHAAFLAAAAVIAGAVPLVNSTMRRRSFQDRFPAAFFMKVEGKKT
jgi:AraC-like DNA-binding protein